MRTFGKLFLQAGGIGRLPHGGAACTSVVATVLFYLSWPSLAAFPLPVRFAVCIAVLLFMFLLSLFFIISIIGRPPFDLRWIVIDEVIGTWIALLPFLFTKALSGVSVALTCGLFLLIDWRKPFGIARIDHHPSAAAVILDDCAAGLLTALIVGLTLR